MTRVLKAIVLVAVAVAMLAVAAPSASAYSPTTVSAAGNHFYEGWGNVVAARPGACSMEFGVGCQPSQTSFTAYQWSGGWRATTRRAGDQVYIYPFGGEWNWTWTASRGWLAMRGYDLEIPLSGLPATA